MTEKDDISLFDLDGTLCDYDSAIRRDYDKIKSPNDSPYIPFFNNNNQPEHIKNRIRMIRNQIGWWENLEEFKLGFDVLNIARDLNFTLHILTKGPYSSTNAWTEKVKWVRKHILDGKITITEDKSLVYGKVLVDDFPEYIQNWLIWRPRGLVIMPAHEWNGEYIHPNVIRYDGSNLEQVRLAMNAAKERASLERLIL